MLGQTAAPAAAVVAEQQQHWQQMTTAAARRLDARCSQRTPPFLTLSLYLSIYLSRTHTLSLPPPFQREAEAEAKGEATPPEYAFDSNCITPGTGFMARLGKHLRFFIRKKIAEDPVWQAPVVIFSGARCAAGGCGCSCKHGAMHCAALCRAGGCKLPGALRW